MNIFDIFVIIVIFVLIKIGIVLTMLNINKNKSDQNIGVLYNEKIDCVDSWSRQTFQNIKLDNSCYDVKLSKYKIIQEAIGDGVKCQYPPSQLTTLGKGIQLCRTPTSSTTCKTINWIDKSPMATQLKNWVNSTNTICP